MTLVWEAVTAEGSLQPRSGPDEMVLAEFRTDPLGRRLGFGERNVEQPVRVDIDRVNESGVLVRQPERIAF